MGESGLYTEYHLERPEGRRPLVRPRHRSKDNIKINVGEVGWRVKNWIDLDQDIERWGAVMNAVMYLQVL
jgi:hypothetical protein